MLTQQINLLLDLQMALTQQIDLQIDLQFVPTVTCYANLHTQQVV